MTRVSFDDQVVIVTGSGRGLGRAYALELARLGAAVVVNDVKDAGLMEGSAANRVVDEIRAAGGRAAPSHHSVATPEGGQALVDCALEHFGTVDALVNNAGFLREGYFADLTVDQWNEVVAVHLGGAFFVTQPAWRVMSGNGYGRVVFVGSSAGLWGRAATANYCAAKAALWGLCRALAIEGPEHGILTNYLMPAGATSIGHEGGVPPRAQAEMDARLEGAHLPDERLDPAWVAPMVAYLASPACTVNGEAISAIYGRYARVFAGVGRGWASPGPSTPTPDDIVARWAEIERLDDYLLPDDVFDEVHAVAARDRAR